jgi:alkanesulfonate monooxygenase SsuD/methylene tetrahydromethanopterin reductase-like flavin-dependent oxidoreductase (luciferase family)
MDFNIHLSMNYPGHAYGGARFFTDLVEQAKLADTLGFRSVSLSEHHLLSIGLNPAPLITAVKIAAHTRSVDIVTSVAVLNFHDMRTYAGEVVMADIFTGGRLVLGVGRGGYAYEAGRLGVPMAETRERFDESLDVLQALMTREEVAWDGKYYRFDPLTVMPRPTRPGGPRMMMAVMNPEGIYRCARKGFNILTTPLTGDNAQFRAQVDAFRRAKSEMGEAGQDLILQASRAAFVTTSDAHRRAKLEQAQSHYGQLDNLYTGPGLVDAGMVRSLPRTQTIDELAESILVCSAAEMVDRLAVFAECGVDRASLVLNFGSSHQETLETIQRIAEDVMPHFATKPAAQMAVTA